MKVLGLLQAAAAAASSVLILLSLSLFYLFCTPGWTRVRTQCDVRGGWESGVNGERWSQGWEGVEEGIVRGHMVTRQLLIAMVAVWTPGERENGREGVSFNLYLLLTRPSLPRHYK